ncbi:MAG: metallophosphoesterase [Gemmatimonadaceae bacterium]|nr:metallophosphoesterase [Gemmatimonadaceae bacterium]
MLVGVLSDTHDRVPAVAALLAKFNERGVGLVLHAGDFCSPFSLLPFQDAGVALAGIFGRNDGDHEGLRAIAQQGMGHELFESPHSLTIGDHKVLLVHDITDASDRSIAAHDVVVHGHLHRQEMKTRGNTLIVNPGEACGWLHGSPGGALIDLQTKHVEFVKLDGPEWQT